MKYTAQTRTLLAAYRRMGGWRNVSARITARYFLARLREQFGARPRPL